MRLLSLAAVATLAISLVSATGAHHPASPRAGNSAINHRQAKRKELWVKERYPELFEKRTKKSNAPGDECDFKPNDNDHNDHDGDHGHGGGRNKKRTDVIHEPSFNDDVNLLKPREVADFLVGRGTYVHANGTQLIDRSFLEGLERGEAIIAKRSRWSRALRDAVSDSLVSIGMPVYRSWKERTLTGLDSTFHLSETTAFQVRDIPMIERALLDHPEFKETQVLGYRITRRFIEAANALN